MTWLVFVALSSCYLRRQAGASRFASASVRSREHRTLSSSAWTIGQVLDEEARIDTQGSANSDKAVDHVRYNMMWSDDERFSGNVDRMVQMVEEFTNESSDGHSSLTCEQGLRFLMVLTKWRLDSMVTGPRELSPRDIVNCENEAYNESTCKAMRSLADRCYGSASRAVLLAERASLFGTYVPRRAHEDLEEGAPHVALDADDVDAESEEPRTPSMTESEPTTPTVSDASSPSAQFTRDEVDGVAPQWYPACETGGRIHKAASPFSSCSPSSEQGSCPRTTSTFCYHEDLAARCCCPERSIKTIGELKVYKYATASCAFALSMLGVVEEEDDSVPEASAADGEVMHDASGEAEPEHAESASSEEDVTDGGGVQDSFLFASGEGEGEHAAETSSSDKDLRTAKDLVAALRESTALGSDAVEHDFEVGVAEEDAASEKDVHGVSGAGEPDFEASSAEEGATFATDSGGAHGSSAFASGEGESERVPEITTSSDDDVIFAKDVAGEHDSFALESAEEVTKAEDNATSATDAAGMQEVDAAAEAPTAPAAAQERGGENVQSILFPGRPPLGQPPYFEPCAAGERIHVIHSHGIGFCKATQEVGSCPGSLDMRHYCYHSNLTKRCCCRSGDVREEGFIRVHKFGTDQCGQAWPRS
eukprot:TRINITY_DN2788_c2_g1_i1.p1 TRINITY_DN2788_c2_g1~~TRINITY_DN2788_c2_g1_i1.p1  ORF type:complete len:668 (-),score=126.15 TRINITY_DN2788_c2_g1_i1:44-1993(-)